MIFNNLNIYGCSLEKKIFYLKIERKVVKKAFKFCSPHKYLLLWYLI